MERDAIITVAVGKYGSGILTLARFYLIITLYMGLAAVTHGVKCLYCMMLVGCVFWS